MRLYASLASASALALLSAESGSGSGSDQDEGIAPPPPTEADLAEAEAAREAAVTKLAEIRAETTQANAEAEQLVEEAGVAKAALDAAVTKLAEIRAETEKAEAEAVQLVRDAQAAKAKAAKARKAGEAAASAEPEVVETQAYDGPRQAIVWAAPGHALLSVGVLISVPSEEAESLRGAGRARFASDEEVAAQEDPVPELSGL
jgi:chromosome segregation ATPase